MTLLANSEAALGAATLDGNYRLEPRYLTEFRTSSGLIVDFANSIVLYGVTPNRNRSALNQNHA